MVLGPVPAHNALPVCLLPHQLRANFRDTRGLSSTTYLRTCEPRLAVSKRLSSTSSVVPTEIHSKMPAATTGSAWVGYKGAAGFDLRSELPPDVPSKEAERTARLTDVHR